MTRLPPFLPPLPVEARASELARLCKTLRVTSFPAFDPVAQLAEQRTFNHSPAFPCTSARVAPAMVSSVLRVTFRAAESATVRRFPLSMPPKLPPV